MEDWIQIANLVYNQFSDVHPIARQARKGLLDLHPAIGACQNSPKNTKT